MIELVALMPAMISASEWLFGAGNKLVCCIACHSHSAEALKLHLLSRISCGLGGCARVCPMRVRPLSVRLVLDRMRQLV